MLTATIENLLNRNLGSSPAAQDLCVELAGRRFGVVVSTLRVRVVIESLGRSLRVTREREGAPPEPPCDAEIEGSPISLMALAGNDPEAVIQRGDARISGDAEIAQRFQQLGRLLRPDAEEEFAALFGDGFAHQFARVARSLLDFGRRGGTTTVRNAAEYFAHETGDLVPRAEADVFLGEVDRLREDVDRFEARLAALEAQRGMPPAEQAQ
jgi:ubiquinone biosynthesis protein UbiJ